MIIEQIKLKNFGPFIGENTINTSIANTKNVTLIHAQNNVGKTFILRGIIWCFYNYIIPDDNHKEIKDIINQDILKSSPDVECEVSIRFSHDNGLFQCTRKKGKKDDFYMFGIDSNGNTQCTISKPSIKIEEILPQKLAKFFFLRGENSALIDNKDNLSKSIKNILGFNYWQNIIELLQDSIKKINKVINDQDLSNSRVNILRENIDKSELEYEDKKKNIISLTQLHDSMETEKDNIVREIQESSKYEDIHRQINEIEKDIVKVENDITLLKNRRVKWFRGNLFSLFSDDLVSSGIEHIDSDRHKGKIPSSYQESFIEELLSKNKCICGCDLSLNIEARREIESLVNTGGNPRVFDAFMESKSMLKNLKTLKNSLIKDYKNISDSIVSNELRLRQLKDKRNLLPTEIPNYSTDDIALKIRRKNKLVDELKKTSNDITYAEIRIKELLSNIKRFQDQIDNEVIKNKETEKKYQIRSFLEDALIVINDEFTKMKDNAKLSIESQMKDIVKNTITQDLPIVINDNFIYESENVGGGQARVLQLAFIASILNFNKNNDSLLINSGAVIPLVIDSGFGETDEDYRKKIATFLPDLSHQLMILVSGTQGSVIADTLKSNKRVNSEYVLKRDVTTTQKNDNQGLITINGKSVVTKYYEREFNKTYIEEVKC